MEKRKSAEKARRDALKQTMDQVRTLLPAQGRRKRISKEALVEGAYDYIMDLQSQTFAKSELAYGLEVEILALKRSMDMV
ncbi:hypothetical protein BC830DRAFT_1112663 [Chytriomyces sp. MP71]|nr:hypothetical protein BC830DRAFT_1112663 [Chytriomyces sp. MP71]